MIDPEHGRPIGRRGDFAPGRFGGGAGHKNLTGLGQSGEASNRINGKSRGSRRRGETTGVVNLGRMDADGNRNRRRVEPR